MRGETQRIESGFVYSGKERLEMITISELSCISVEQEGKAKGPRAFNQMVMALIWGQKELLPAFGQWSCQP